MKVEKNHLRNRRCFFASAKRLFNGALLLSLLFLAGGCKQDFDEYYEDPDWLEDDAYKVLQDRGGFTNYLKLVDRTLYAKQLHGSGSYTFFAPNDAAFAAYLQENGFQSVDDIPEDVAADIVSFTMVYNQYEKEHLGDVWSGGIWETGMSMRKMTPSYKTIWKDVAPNGSGDSVYVYDSYFTPFSDTYADHRYLPIYTQTFFNANGLVATDYQTVFPSSQWNGENGNVLDAQIITSNIYASNGVVHELDKVVTLPKNLDEMILTNAEEPARAAEGWSMLKNFFYNKFADGSYQFLSYTEDKDAALYYSKVYPELESELSVLYRRQYNLSSLLIGPNYNGYVSVGEFDYTENNAYTLFLPSDAALKEYVENIVLKYTDDFNKLSSDVLETLVRSHFSRRLVWPSQFKTAKNVAGTENGEFINGEGTRGVGFDEFGVNTDKIEVATNGFVYHIDHVIPSGVFSSVYGRILLDPVYSYEQMLVSGSSLYSSLINHTPNAEGIAESSYQYSMCLASDTLLKADGFAYDNLNSRFTNDLLLGDLNADARIRRLINNGIFIRELGADDYATPAELDFSKQPEALGGAYDGYGYVVNYAGELVRYKDNQLQAIGNIQDGTVVTVTADDTHYVNGTVYTMDRLLQYSQRETNSSSVEGWNQSSSVLADVNKYLNEHPECSIFKSFWDATLYSHLVSYVNATDFHTVLIPTNDAMQQAIDSGLIPAVADSATFAGNNTMTVYGDFVLGHILQGMVYADDGEARVYTSDANYSNYPNSTAMRVTEGDLDLISARTYVKVQKTGADNKLQFMAKDHDTGVITGINSNDNTVVRDINKSNVMGRLSVIHQLNGFLYFRINKKTTE